MKEAYRTSLIRGVLVGALVGAAAFLTAWAQTSDVKLLISSGATPAIMTWLGFLGYGAVDAQKQAAEP